MIDNLNGHKTVARDVLNAKYHHNSRYEDASSICEHGILTLNDLNDRKVRTFDETYLKRMSDIDSHVNGTDAISLAVVGLDDLYLDECEYDPFFPTRVDFLVSSDVVAGRSACNYGNEFLSYKSISNDKLKSLDIRLLQLIDMYERGEIRNLSIQDLVKRYNSLKEIALAIKLAKLDLPLREMSNNPVEFDLDKLITAPKLVIK